MDGPAAVANGDDAYGRDALTQLCQSAEWTASASLALARCALVAYPILNTLSEHGGVSRGWVRTDGDLVISIEEMLQVRSGASPAHLDACTTSGEPRTLPRTALGSMNLWLLGPRVRPLLQREFDRYPCQPKVDAHPPNTEFYLSTVLDRLRLSGELAIRLAGTADGWFGLTFAADLPAATRRMADLHREGHYADPLAAMVDPFRHC